MTLSVGFQGEPGAFSEEAALALLGNRISTHGYRTFADLVSAVDARDVHYGLLPCENTIFGQIAEAYDLLGLYAGVKVVDETTHLVRQCLIGLPGATLNQLDRVASHPVALEQCRHFLATHPQLRITAMEDTAGAVRTIMESADARAGAIGAALAAQRYGAIVLQHAIQDDEDNMTRFFVIASADAKPRRALGRACLALTLPNSPGSLYAALTPIAQAGLNLRALLARPSRQRPFEYRFYLEIDAGENELVDITAALAPQARVLGRY
jgi:prephenate dehydratase